MERFNRRLADDLARLKRRHSEPQPRATVSIPPPPYGNKTESVAGTVASVSKIYLPKRFDLDESSVLARSLNKTFPGLQVTQITILVDDILNDPKAEDMFSYTVWVPAGIGVEMLSHRQFVIAVVVSTDILRIGRKWIVKAIETPSS